MLLDKGKGKEFKGKSLNDLEGLGDDLFASSEDEDEDRNEQPIDEESMFSGSRVLRTAIRRTARIAGTYFFTGDLFCATKR